MNTFQERNRVPVSLTADRIVMNCRKGVHVNAVRKWTGEWEKRNLMNFSQTLWKYVTLGIGLSYISVS